MARLRETASARAAACLLGLLACGEAAEIEVPSQGLDDAPGEAVRRGSPTARWEVVEELRAGLAQERHPSDGAGRAWIESDEPLEATASSSIQVPIVFEAGELGVAPNGMVQLQVSPFWGWSTPQTEVPEAPGYTTVEASAEDVELELSTLGEQLLAIRIAGRGLRAGERLRIVYGAGELGARADRFAERESPFWIAVDGDGDGVRAFLEDSPTLRVAPRAPARLVVTLPSVARPGEEIEAVIAVLDAAGSTGVAFAGELRLTPDPGLELPQRVALASADEGRARVAARVSGEGVLRLRVETGEGIAGESNPLTVSAEGPRVLWGDLHGHSNLSDGTGTPEDYFRYARDVAGLDVVALTDHDHWGILPLDSHPGLWKRIQEATRRAHEPGRFVTLLGYEWTSWIYGHRHVLYFGDEGEVHSSIDPRFESPQQLWAALEGRRALTFAHHSAGGPVATDWEIPPDPRFEPVTEISSVHGSSEALDSPLVIYSPVPGNFVRDVLDRGYRFGFIGSGDSHDGHPGLAHLASPSGGLAAILAEAHSREAVLRALRERRVYATNGPRILLRCALGEHRMGAIVKLPDGEPLSAPLFVRVVSPGPLERLDLVRSGALLEPSLALEGLRDVTVQRPIEDLLPGEYLYVRAVQEDGGVAWSSPIYFDGEAASEVVE